MIRVLMLALALLTPALGQRFAILDMAIPNGSATSGAVGLADQPPLALDLPAALDGTHIKIEYTLDDITWKPIYDNTNSLFLLPVGTNRGIPIARTTEIAWVRKIRLVTTNSTGTSVNQTAARTIRLIVRTLP